MNWGKVTPLPCLHALAPGFVMTSLWLLECTDEECSQSQPSLSVFPTSGLSCDAIFFISLASWWTKYPYEGLQISQFQTAIVFIVTRQFCEPGRAQSLPHALLLSDASTLLSRSHAKDLKVCFSTDLWLVSGRKILFYGHSIHKLSKEWKNTRKP